MPSTRSKFIESYVRLIKKSFLFAAELVFLFVGFVVSLIPCAYLQDTASKSCPVVVILCFSLVCTAWVWIRRKTRKWATAADAEAFLANRCWRQLHPRRAKYVRSIRRWAIWLPSIFAAFVLFFLPAASHLLYLGRSIFPHYRVSIPLNWMVIEYQGSGWLLFSEQGAARHGLTPIWFNRRMPSGVVFLIRDPEHADVWSRPESELANGHTTHLGVRDFRLGMLTSRCYEYRHIYGNAPESSSGILTPPVLWESLCATDPNGINYNLRIAFFGHREDLPTFYKVLNSATTSPNAESERFDPVPRASCHPANQDCLGGTNVLSQLQILNRRPVLGGGSIRSGDHQPSKWDR